jgi:hypothetical protein
MSHYALVTLPRHLATSTMAECVSMRAPAVTGAAATAPVTRMAQTMEFDLTMLPATTAFGTREGMS